MKYAAALLVCAALVASSVAALAESRDTVKVDVPFNFMVNNKTFASGRYTVERTSDNGNGALVIRSVDSKTTMVFLTSPMQPSNQGPVELVFSRTGGTYSLKTVVGELATYSIAPTRSSREIAKQQYATATQSTP